MSKKNIEYKINEIDNGWFEVCSNTNLEGWIVEGTIGSLKNARLFKKALKEDQYKKGSLDFAKCLETLLKAKIKEMQKEKSKK